MMTVDTISNFSRSLASYRSMAARGWDQKIVAQLVASEYNRQFEYEAQYHVLLERVAALPKKTGCARLLKRLDSEGYRSGTSEYHDTIAWLNKLYGIDNLHHIAYHDIQQIAETALSGETAG